MTRGDKGPDYWRVSELCSGCGQPAETTEIDFGIGAYEFWGACGVDTDVQTVTTCCEQYLVPNSWSERVKHAWEVLK